MLPSSRRLSTQTYIPIIIRGMSFHAKSILLKLSRAPKDHKEVQSRFSATVSKKVAKTAVERNKLRRRIYSIISAKLPDVQPNIKGIVVAKPGCEKLSFKELEKQIDELFDISGVILKKK